LKTEKVRYKTYASAVEKLETEMDILELLQIARISKFMFRFQFDRNHKEFVRYFNRYCIKERLLVGPLEREDLFPRKFVGLGLSRAELAFYPMISKKTP